MTTPTAAARKHLAAVARLAIATTAVDAIALTRLHVLVPHPYGVLGSLGFEHENGAAPQRVPKHNAVVQVQAHAVPLKQQRATRDTAAAAANSTVLYSQGQCRRRRPSLNAPVVASLQPLQLLLLLPRRRGVGGGHRGAKRRLPKVAQRDFPAAVHREKSMHGRHAGARHDELALQRVGPYLNGHGGQARPGGQHCRLVLSVERAAAARWAVPRESHRRGTVAVAVAGVRALVGASSEGGEAEQRQGFVRVASVTAGVVVVVVFGAGGVGSGGVRAALPVDLLEVVAVLVALSHQ